MMELEPVEPQLRSMNENECINEKWAKEEYFICIWFEGSVLFIV